MEQYLSNELFEMRFKGFYKHIKQIFYFLLLEIQMYIIKCCPIYNGQQCLKLLLKPLRLLKSVQLSKFEHLDIFILINLTFKIMAIECAF